MLRSHASQRLPYPFATVKQEFFKSGAPGVSLSLIEPSELFRLHETSSSVPPWGLPGADVMESIATLAQTERHHSVFSSVSSQVQNLDSPDVMSD